MIALHLSGTVIHEACHQAAHPNRVINAVLGHGSGLILGFAYPVFTRVHLQHHANVNHPRNDADHFVSTGGPLWMIAPRFFYHEVFFFQRRLWRKYELLEWALSRLCLVALIGLSLQYGFIHFVLNYWFVPALIVGVTYGLFFDYFPHRPFQDQDRWHNARTYASPVLNVLILSQNYHLIHHLWPSVPWYRIQAAYYAVKPLLDAKGSLQTFGVFDDRRNFAQFLYDIFLGVHFEPTSPPPPSREALEKLIQASPNLDPPPVGYHPMRGSHHLRAILCRH